MTAGEVADLLRVSQKTVYVWAREGVLPFVQPAGKHGSYRFRREDVERLLNPETAA